MNLDEESYILVHMFCYECGSIRETCFHRTIRDLHNTFKFSQYSIYNDLYLPV